MLVGCGSESTIPTPRNVVPDDEDGRLVSRILNDIFLLGNPHREARALAVRDLFFNMVG